MGREHWVETTIGDCCQLNPRHKVEDESIEVTFVTMADISEDVPLFKNSQVRLLSEVRRGFTHFANGDVLFAKITPCMENGKAAIAQGLKNDLGCGTTELHVLRPIHGVMSTYLYYFIHQQKFRDEAEQHFTGSVGQQRVPIDFIANTPFPLPPLNEQQRIVAKLDALLPKVKHVQARLAKIPGILKKFRQSVLAAACAGRLTEDWREGKGLPEWKEKKLGEITDIQGGIQKTPSRKPVRYFFPYLRVANVYRNRLSLDKIEYFELFNEDELKKFCLQYGDILVVEGNGSKEEIGRVAIWHNEIENCVHQNHIIRCRPKKDLCSPEYIMAFLNSQVGIGVMMDLAVTTAGLYSLSTGKLKQISIPLPPLEEQYEIVRRVERLFALADSLEAKYDKARERVAKIEQALLAKALRGELAPADPDDEPADALSQRILIEKARSDAGKKPRKKAERLTLSQIKNA